MILDAVADYHDSPGIPGVGSDGDRTVEVYAAPAPILALYGGEKLSKQSPGTGAKAWRVTFPRSAERKRTVLAPKLAELDSLWAIALFRLSPTLFGATSATLLLICFGALQSGNVIAAAPALFGAIMSAILTVLLVHLYRRLKLQARVFDAKK